MVALTLFETQKLNEDEDLEEEEGQEGKVVAEVEKNEPEEGPQYPTEEEEEQEEHNREGGGGDTASTSTHGRKRLLSDAEAAGSNVTKKTVILFANFKKKKDSLNFRREMILYLTRLRRLLPI